MSGLCPSSRLDGIFSGAVCLVDGDLVLVRVEVFSELQVSRTSSNASDDDGDLHAIIPGRLATVNGYPRVLCSYNVYSVIARNTYKIGSAADHLALNHIRQS